MMIQANAIPFRFFIAAVLVGSWLMQQGAAQEAHSHAAVTTSTAQKSQSNALIQAVRDATERFKDPSAAEAEGYSLQFGCVSGPDWGAMGLHFVNGPLVAGGVLDVAHPQIVIYEPTGNGGVRLIGADFLLLADAWNAKHNGPPQLMGQLFQFFEAPNRFNLPPFYTLHVWAWKDNPNGAFVNWHPHVSCKEYNGPTQ